MFTRFEPRRTPERQTYLRHIFTCDECNAEFSGRPERVSQLLHFCSRTCSHLSQRTGQRRQSTIVDWHGLDRPIEVIKEFKNARDVTIHGTYVRDRLQDEWFVRNGLNLLRITDQDFGQCTSQEEFMRLLEHHMRVKEERQKEMEKNGN